MWRNKKSILVILFYLVALLIHLCSARLNDKFSLLTYNRTDLKMSEGEIVEWITLSSWKDIFALLGWIGVGIGKSEDLLQAHLKCMVKYAHNDS